SQPCLKQSYHRAKEQRPLEQMFWQGIAFHPCLELIAGMSFGSGNYKPLLAFFLDQPDIQKEHVCKTDHQPLNITVQHHPAESPCSAFYHTDRTINNQGQDFSETDPKHIEPILRFCGRFRRILDNGWRITGKHQTRLEYRHSRSE